MKAVLLISNLILSALGPNLPERIRTVSAVVVTASLSGITDLIVQAFFPGLAGDLGLYLPLLAATCVLLNGGGAFAYENTVTVSGLEGFFQGLGYTLVLVLVSILREFLGKGSFGEGVLNRGRGIQIFPAQFAAGGMIFPVGAFLVLACVFAFMQSLRNKSQKTRKEEGAAGK